MPIRCRIAVAPAVASGVLLVVALPVHAQTTGGDSGVTVPIAPTAAATVDPAFLRQQPSGVPFSTSSIALVAIIAIVVVAAVLNARGKARR
jgi:hypothetical protein